MEIFDGLHTYIPAASNKRAKVQPQPQVVTKMQKVHRTFFSMPPKTTTMNGQTGFLQSSQQFSLYPSEEETHNTNTHERKECRHRKKKKKKKRKEKHMILKSQVGTTLPLILIKK